METDETVDLVALVAPLGSIPRCGTNSRLEVETFNIVTKKHKVFQRAGVEAQSADEKC